MTKQFKRLLRNMVLLLPGSALLGTLSLLLVFYLPTETVKRHVLESVDVMMTDPDQFPKNSFSNYVWANRESYTDTIMVQNTFESIPEKNAFEHAMRAYHSDLEKEFWTPEATIKAFSKGADQSNMYLHEYPRYWHGYLLYLKPLLMLFNWEQLTTVGVFVQIFLMITVIALSVWKKQLGVAVSMVVGFLFMKPVLIFVSLAMTVCWVITLAALIFMLLKNGWLQKEKLYPEFFLMVGVLTSFFDFLSYPIVTLAFPLCAFFLINNVDKNGTDIVDSWDELRQKLQRPVGYSVCWGIGYAGMWALKWIIADVTLRTGTVKDAIWSIIGRTETIGGRSRFNGGFYVIGLNLQEYDRSIYPVMAVAVILTSLVLIVIACRKSSVKKVLMDLVPYVIVFCIPFAWIIVVQHHSALHARFTFRIIAAAVLAVGCMGIQTWKEMKKCK